MPMGEDPAPNGPEVAVYACWQCCASHNS